MSEPRTSRAVDPSTRLVARLLVGVAVVIGTLHFLILPPWMGEDEPWHLEYIHHISEGHLPTTPAKAWTREMLSQHNAGVLWAHDHMPSIEYEEAEAYQAAVLESMSAHKFPERVDLDPRHANPRGFDDVQPEDPHFNAFNHPRLYYLLLGMIVRVSGASEPVVELYVARAFSLFCYVLAVAFAVGLAREVFDDRRAVLIAGLLVVLFPMHARQSAVVNNDVLAKAMSAGVLLFATRFALGREDLRAFALATMLLAVGLMAKTTAAGGLAVLATAVVLRRFSLRGDSEDAARSSARAATFALLGAVLVITGLAVYYWLYSLNPALPKTPARLVENLVGVLTTSSALELWGSTVGATNWNTRLLPDGVYLAVGSIGSLAFLGGLVTLFRRRPWIANPALFLSFVAIATQFTLLILRGKALGRYWMPVLPAFGVVFAAALLGAWGSNERSEAMERWRDRAATLGVVLVVLYAGWFLFGALVVNHYLVWSS